MTDPKPEKTGTSTVEPQAQRLKERQKARAEAERLKERRRADAEARRQIEQANREAEERFRAYEERQAAIRSQERAEAEQKEAERLAKAEERKAALQEKAEARKLAQREKAEARAAAEKEKAAAAEEKQTQKAQQAEAKAQLQALKNKLKEELRTQTKEYGAALAELLSAFADAFSQRADIRIVEKIQAEPVALQELLNHQELPASLLTFYQHFGEFRLSWAFADEEQIVGSLVIPTLHELSPNKDATDYALVAGKQLARAFISKERAQDFQRLLNQSALLWSTTGCLVDALVKKGLEEKTARTLVLFLGESARILVHRLDTEEGKRRNELLTNIPPGDKLNRKLIEAMSRGPSLDKAQWERLIARHKDFLENGGGGGSFVIEVQHGLPVISYRGQSEALGQALLVCENLSGVKFDAAVLSFSAMVGIRAENTSFAKVDLSHANLSYSVLNGSKFTSANLAECDFTGCKLAGANFRGADLTGTNFELADLTGANFAGAITKNTRFGGAMVRGVKY